MTRFIKNNRYNKDDRVAVNLPGTKERMATIVAVSSGYITISGGKEKEHAAMYRVAYDDFQIHEVNCWVAEKWLSDPAKDEQERLEALQVLDSLRQ